jgi:hypothetical protein
MKRLNIQEAAMGGPDKKVITIGIENKEIVSGPEDLMKATKLRFAAWQEPDPSTGFPHRKLKLPDGTYQCEIDKEGIMTFLKLKVICDESNCEDEEDCTYYYTSRGWVCK